MNFVDKRVPQIMRHMFVSTSFMKYTTTRTNVLLSTWNPRTIHKIVPRMDMMNIRLCHSMKTDEKYQHVLKMEEMKKQNWVPVYRFPSIMYAVLFARAKLLQTVASVIYLPYSSYQFITGSVDSTWFYSTVAVAVTAPTLLAIFSRYMNRVIGVISMSENNEFVRVGYLTFWGARKNKFLEVADVLPLGEVSSDKGGAVVKFSWFSESSYLFLFTKPYEIVDEQRAKLLFGDLKVFSRPEKSIEVDE